MLKLYSVPVSLYCAKTRIALRNKDLAFEELAPPDGEGGASYKDIVPSGNLPALVHNDFLVSDSEAIAEYLEEVFPDPAMLFGGHRQRAVQRELSRFHDTRLEPALRKIFPIVKTGVGDSQGVAHEISMRLGQLAKMLERRSWSALCLGDCGFAVTFPWISTLCEALGVEVDWPAPVLAYRAEIEAMPAVRAELEAYLPVMKPWAAQFTQG